MYEVALSFAGEQRGYVEAVARTLQARGVAVFYDRFETVRLWGMDLAEEFQRIYEHGSGKVVMFVSEEYVDKYWTRHERRSAISRHLDEDEEYVLVVRFDSAEVPGLPGTGGYLLAAEYSPFELAAMIVEKLGVPPFSGKASDVPPPTSTSFAGEVAFDYSSFNGRYVIGRGQLEFETDWSKASDTEIHVYNDPPSIFGVATCPPNVRRIADLSDVSSLDFTSRARSPRLGQIVVFQNRHGLYAAVQVLSIKDDTRGDAADELRMRYAIQPDGSADFTSLCLDF